MTTYRVMVVDPETGKTRNWLHGNRALNRKDADMVRCFIARHFMFEVSVEPTISNERFRDYKRNQRARARAATV